MRKQRNKQKRPVAQHGNPQMMQMPNGSMMVVPAGGKQSTYGQTFYGPSTGNVATTPGALFSPGTPLAPIQGVNPQNMPIQWRFPVAINTFPVDRSLGDSNIPSFAQLRSLATCSSNIKLAERTWLDMVPRMKLQIGLRPDLVAQGIDEQQYEKDKTFFYKFWEKPDKVHDMHSWLRMLLIDQTQIDELYLYRHLCNDGSLYALEPIEGDYMKPLIDSWGRIPQAPDFGYQQYPWGLPGEEFTSDEFIHYQEFPSIGSPYGTSRVQSIIFNLNLALKKMARDLANFTEGNLPPGYFTAPANSNWSQDEIDTYERMYNANMAGNPGQQRRIRFMQPGWEFHGIPDFIIDKKVDEYELNITLGEYGLSMGDVGFTGDIHKSSGDSQQNMTYRRTIDPLAMVYGAIITNCTQNDFEPSLNGDKFIATFGGYDEEEDLVQNATAYSILTNAGILGITAAGKLLNLPEEPDAPYIGRIMNAQNPPVFLDEMAKPEMLQASNQAQLAGYKLAANPPDPTAVGGNDSTVPDGGKGKGEDESSDSKSSEKQTKQNGVSAKLPAKSTNRAAGDEPGLPLALRHGLSRASEQEQSDEYRRWRSRAIEDVKHNRSLRGFATTIIPEAVHQHISDELADCMTVEDVRAVFERARGHSVTHAPTPDVAAHVKALFESVERRGSTMLAEK